MVLGWSPLSILSDSPTFHSRWLLSSIVHCCTIISQNESHPPFKMAGITNKNFFDCLFLLYNVTVKSYKMSSNFRCSNMALSSSTCLPFFSKFYTNQSYYEMKIITSKSSPQALKFKLKWSLVGQLSNICDIPIFYYLLKSN